MKSRINIPLLIALLIPIAMVVFIASSIYLPSLFVKPTTNFLYTTDGYSSPFRYDVKNGKLEKITFSDNYSFNGYAPPAIFIHDVETNKSREITFEESQSLQLDAKYVSDDGFEFTEGSYSSGMFPFGYSGSYRDNYFLKKGSYSKKLDLNTSGNYYGFRFIGWVK